MSLIESDSITIERLKSMIQDAHLNFLIGAGTSAPYFSILGDVEEALTTLSSVNISENAKVIIRSSLQAYYFEKVILPNISILEEGAEASTILSTYEIFLKTLNQLLLERKSSLLGKQANIFTTNIDLVFEKTLDKHASDIGELTKENIGQIQINALLEKDLLRQNAIKNAYKELENANGGQLPIDISELNKNINNALTKKLKTNVYEDKLGTIKKDIDGLIKNGRMTFDDFENLRSNLADEMRTNQSGSARAAAHIIREQLENLPFPENMQHLKPLADKARSLYKERMEVIKNNPAYKAAIKEADTMEEAEQGLAALNADKFHDKYVTNSTPESVRRMVEELKDSPKAIKALKAGDILNARDALVPNTMTPQLKPDMYNKYLRSQAGKAKYVHDAESLQDLLDYGILSSKVAKPSENVFNYSNSYSAYLGDLLKEGLKVTGEGALALKTGGASIIPMNVGKGLYSKYKSNKFAQETTHPHSGLIEEKP